MKSKDNTSLEDIAGAINGLATQIDERFSKVDERFDSLESTVNDIQREQREVKEWMTRIENRLMGVESDIKEIYDRLVILEKKFPNISEKEFREVETKLDKMIKWATEVSRRSNIPMPKL